MKIIGLTGGIGSGKSTIAKVFIALGYPVYHADNRAKYLLENDENIKLRIKALLGNEAFIGDKPNRKFIAEAVFNNQLLLNGLNQIVHPAVKSDFIHWLSSQNSEIVFREAAILFESGSYSDCYRIINVSAPEPVRIKRVLERDGTNEEAVKSRIKNQISDEERIKRSHFVITNNDKQLVLPQLFVILKKINE